MASELLKLPTVILASKSPRRQEILQLMGIDFRVELRDVDESFPPSLPAHEVAIYIAEKKMTGFDSQSRVSPVITADTVVISGGQILGKPVDEADARRMLSQLSGTSHRVITGVVIAYGDERMSFSDTTNVVFRELSDEEIAHYVATYRPMDKAGAYGIQEWIGLTAIKRIEGSYTNVVGLPSEKVYAALKKLSL